MSSPTRLYSLLDRSKITGEARDYFETTVDFGALEIMCWGARRPPWHLIGVTPDGGSVGHLPFDSMEEAKEAGERFFGGAMDGWREVPAGERDDFVSRQVPGYIDWRIGTGPAEREPLFRAELRFAEYAVEDDHDHCEFCWSTFFAQDVPAADVPGLMFGFVTDDDRWVCEPCCHVLRDMLQFSAIIDRPRQR
jgi:hypothetical protein